MCGTPLVYRQARGRPESYCGDACRRTVVQRRQDLAYWTRQLQLATDDYDPSRGVDKRIPYAQERLDAATRRAPAAYLGVTPLQRSALRSATDSDRRG